MRQFTLLIVGAGKMGAFFDTPQSGAVLSHAHAFSRHPGFRLLGFVDRDLRQAARAAELWGGEAFASIAEASARGALDAVIVAVPDEFHLPVLQELAAYPVRLVLAEKPLARTEAEAEQLVGLYRERGITLAVNYTRRYLPGFAALRERIASGAYGRFLAGTGYYGKGTMHNGSHMVDLLRFLLGEMTVESSSNPVADWSEEDPSCSALLLPECGGRFLMQSVDCRCYTIFEMDLLFERGRLRLVDSAYAVEEYAVEESALFSGYRILAGRGKGESALDSALCAVADSLHAHLDRGEPLPCSGADGARTLAISLAVLGGAA